MATTVDQKIEQLAARLETALGANLVSLTLYGSAARNQQVDGRSDINLLLITRDATTEALRGAGPVLAEWIGGGETAPLIFSEDEWRSSADVFPIEIEDMRDAHRVIRGRDPLDGMVTDRVQLRDQLEREVRSKLLRLRAEYISGGTDPKALARLLENSLSTFLVMFRATLRLKGVKPPAGQAELIQATGKAVGLKTTPLEWALASRSGKAPSALQPFDPIAAQYVDVVEQLADVVNAL
jgi:hypothetical protein